MSFNCMQTIHVDTETDLNFGSVNVFIVAILFLGEDLSYFLKRGLVKDPEAV